MWPSSFQNSCFADVSETHVQSAGLSGDAEAGRFSDDDSVVKT